MNEYLYLNSSERSLIDEMTNFVQSAFGGHDAKLFQRNEVRVCNDLYQIQYYYWLVN